MTDKLEISLSLFTSASSTAGTAVASLRVRLLRPIRLAQLPLSRARLHTMPSSTIAPQLVPQHLGNFDLIVQEQLEFADLRVAKWRSRETGLKVVHIDVEGTSWRCSGSADVRRSAHPGSILSRY